MKTLLKLACVALAGAALTGCATPSYPSVLAGAGVLDVRFFAAKDSAASREFCEQREKNSPSGQPGTTRQFFNPFYDTITHVADIALNLAAAPVMVTSDFLSGKYLDGTASDLVQNPITAYADKKCNG